MLEQESSHHTVESTNMTDAKHQSFVPETHPRAESLRIRELLVDGFERGLVAREGLLAHGRAEALDYLLGEKTGKPARHAIRAAAASLILAKRPVISINGNVAALCPEKMIKLARQTGASVEINLFYASKSRQNAISQALRNNGADDILGVKPEDSVMLSGLDSARRVVDKNGIFVADLVLVPLEDGDRTAALVKSGKKVITFDLNPLSRTAQTADITIVDNIVRAASLLIAECKRLQNMNSMMVLQDMVSKFDNKKNLNESIMQIKDNLKESMSDA